MPLALVTGGIGFIGGHLVAELLRRDYVVHVVDDLSSNPISPDMLFAELGNPYGRIGADRDGRVGIDFGVYGVPETYVIDRQGKIARKFVGFQQWDSPDMLAYFDTLLNRS